jgi:3-oxoacyl-[acyl-carrier protein] reductase
VGKQGNFGQANYATAKSGMFGFTRTLALELAPTGSTANCIAPGFTRTDMLAEVSDEVQEQILEEIPLGRFAEVKDITGLVRFLASDESSYITGEVIDVNGAMDL